MQFETLEERYKFVENLTEVVKEQFKDNFNIFIFGSFLTDHFKVGKSDLDLAIYTDGDFMDLDVIISDFLVDKIKSDIIWIETASRLNYVDIDALSGYRCTEWYPDCLRTHKAQLAFARIEDMNWRIQLKNRMEKAVQNYGR